MRPRLPAGNRVAGSNRRVVGLHPQKPGQMENGKGRMETESSCIGRGVRARAFALGLRRIALAAFACAGVHGGGAATLVEGFTTPGNAGITLCNYRTEYASRMAAPPLGSGLTWGGYTHASGTSWQGSVLVSGSGNRLELYAVGSGKNDAIESANYQGTYAYAIFSASGGTVPDTALDLARIHASVQSAASGQSLRWLARDLAGRWYVSGPVAVAAGSYSFEVAGMDWYRVDAAAEAYMNTPVAGGARTKKAIADPSSLAAATPDLSATTGGGFYIESGDANPSAAEYFILNDLSWVSDQVELISPLDGVDVTDIALSFRWWRQAWAGTYQLQVGSDPSFSTLLMDELVLALPGNDPQANGDDRWADFQQVGCLPEDVLPAGEYYWRVRAHDTNNLAHGPWSAVRSVSVNDDHGTQAPARPISAANPLFALEAWASNPEITETHWADFWGNIPEDIRPYTCITFERAKHFDHETWLDAYALVEQSGMNCMVMAAGPIPFQCWEPLAELEWVFQHVPNVHGVLSGETFWVYSNVQWKPEAREVIRYMERIIQLCAKYGKYYLMADGNWMESWKWDRYFAKEESFGSGSHDQYWMDPDFLRKHRQWLVYAPKSNICWDFHQMNGATQGAWLAGLCDNLGCWVESWFWQDVGFRQPFEPPLKFGEGDYAMMPASFWNTMMTLGAAQGASVYVVSGQGNTTMWEYDPASSAPYTALWDRKGRKTPVLDNVIVPFIRAVVEQRLVPSKNEVLGALKIAVRPGPNDDPLGMVPKPVTYRKYDALYKGTFGVEDSAPTNHIGGELWDIVPRTGRYPFIPILPDPVQTLSNAPGVAVYDVAALTNASQVADLFNAHYALHYAGDAWVDLVGDRFFILSSEENQDVVQDFSIGLPGGAITNLSGSIGPFKQIIGRRSRLGHSLLLYANTSMTDEPTTITVACDSPSAPGLAVEPPAALVATNWNGGVFSLTLSHGNFAVNARIDFPLSIAIGNAHVTQEGFFAFDVPSSPELVSEVQTADALATNGWTTLATMVDTSGFTFVDTNAPVHHTRFYRVEFRDAADRP